MLVPVEGDGHGAETNVNTVHHSEGGINPCKLLNDDRLGHVINGRAPVVFRDGDAVEAVFEEGLPFLRRWNLVLISVFNRWRKHRFSKVAYKLSNHLLFVRFAEVHALTILPSMGSLLTRLIRKNYIFFLSLHIPPVEAAN